MKDFKQHYKIFRDKSKAWQHYAAHSHHFWPDVTRDAVIQYWEDSAYYTDQKWDYFFTQKIPQAQRHIANHLNVKHPEQIVFAANTHEFVVRILSCFSSQKKIKILTTDSEFYSFDRQIKALIAHDLAEVDYVKTEDFNSFEQRFIHQSQEKDYDLVFFSHVFFNSGYVVQNLTGLIQSLPAQVVVAIDGYHGFMAIPTDLSEVENRVFYMAGSYKYAQGGEGCCFLYVPHQCQLKPINTGWFASFKTLQDKNNLISYSDSGFRFAGSTMDYTALYRLNAVMDLLEAENISVVDIHQHVQKLQHNFKSELNKVHHQSLNESRIVNHESRHNLIMNAHFYSFELDTVEHTESIFKMLKQNYILTDFRGTRLRFGFGLYQNDSIDLGFLNKISNTERKP